MPTPDFNKIEEALTSESLTEAQLRAILVEAGIPPDYTPDRIFPIGIIVRDGIAAEYDVPRGDMGGFLQTLTEESVDAVRRVKVFPLGTPSDVDRFRVQLQVGRRLG